MSEENMNGQEQVFRQKSLERMGEPEKLDKVVITSRPRLWLGVLGIAIIAAGFIVYLVLGA